jgi:hypothetical protein
VKTVQNCSHSEGLRIYPHADVNAALDQPTSNPPKQHKNDNDDQDDADNADTTVSVAVTVAAEAAAEAAKQENDEDDKENKSQRHDSLPLKQLKPHAEGEVCAKLLTSGGLRIAPRSSISRE